MDPIIGSALIGAGSSLLGGLFGSKESSKQRSQDRALTEHQMAEQRRQFDVTMDESIRRRVADAKAAGLHPLFALGGSAGASPTASIPGQSPTGSFLGEGIAQAGQALRRALDPLTLAQVKQADSAANRNEAEAALLRSQAKRAEIDANSHAVRTYAALETAAQKGTPIPPRLAFKSSEQIRSMRNDPATVAGKHPAWRKYKFGNLFGIDALPVEAWMPWSEEGPFEGINPGSFIPWILRNYRVIGE